MLVCEGLEVSLGAFQLSLEATVNRGERVAVLGASGSGKSTLLSVIAGFIRPNAGRVTWSGEDLARLSPAKRPVSILFQDGNLFPHLSIAQNVGLALRTDLNLSPSDRARVEATLDRVGLTGMGGRRPADLSGGQQGRAALARLLLQNRPIALLDEPFSALDPGLRTEMGRSLTALWEELGLTLIVATHDLRDAERLCDRIWVLDHGQVVLDRPVEGLRSDPPDVLRDWL